MAPTYISLGYPGQPESGNSWGGEAVKEQRRDKIKRAK